MTVSSPLVNVLLRRTLSITSLRNLPVNKRLRHLTKFRLSQILHLCTQKSDCAKNLGPFGVNSPVKLSWRSHFAKIENKKVIAKNQCVNIKKTSYLATNN